MEDNILTKSTKWIWKKTMKESYIDYAMSVIASRALPDVRDGLKAGTASSSVLYDRAE